MFGDIERERSLAHRWATCDDDQIAGLHARRSFIQIDKPGGHTGNRRGILRKLVEACHDIRQQARHGQETLPLFAAHLGNIEYFFLGLIQELTRFAAIRRIRRIGDFLAHAREAAGDRAFTHDLGVEADIDGTRRAF